MLKVENVSKKYAKRLPNAIEDINFKVEKGEIFGLLGLNGAGKTTLMKAITGIHDFEGEILINGFSIKKQPIQAKSHFGYIPDNHATFEELTGREYINFMADVYKVSLEDRRARTKHLGDMFQMTEHLDKPIKYYSHGMKQKIAIMGGIIHEPNLWILDEPLVGLDPLSMQKIMQYMKEYVKDGKTIIFSSHILSIVEELCDRVLIINDHTVKGIYDLKTDKVNLKKEFLGIETENQKKEEAKESE